MPRPEKILTTLAALFSLLFIAGIAVLFHLRFERGDLYPAYSSLRTDPLGTKALYESFTSLADAGVERNYKLPATGAVSPDSTLFSLGVKVHQLRMVSPEEASSLDRFIGAGGRLVIAMYPEMEGDRPEAGCDDDAGSENDQSNDQSRVSDASAHTEEKNSETKQQSPVPELENLEERLGFGFSPLPDSGDKSAAAVAVSADSGLPATIAWHGRLYFTDLDPDWHIIYRHGDYPVMVEKDMGQGSLVLVADSYLFSNEALVNARYPELLTYLAADRKRIVFDEAHLGLHRRQSVAGLLRVYRLHWFIGGLFVLAGLFIWKNSLSFMPPAVSESAAADQTMQQEKDYTEGLISLLRRSIAAGDLLGVSLAEWKKHGPGGRTVPEEVKEKIEELISRKGHEEPIKVYRAIAKMMADST